MGHLTPLPDGSWGCLTMRGRVSYVGIRSIIVGYTADRQYHVSNHGHSGTTRTPRTPDLLAVRSQRILQQISTRPYESHLKSANPLRWPAVRTQVTAHVRWRVAEAPPVGHFLGPIPVEPSIPLSNIAFTYASFTYASILLVSDRDQTSQLLKCVHPVTNTVSALSE